MPNFKACLLAGITSIVWTSAVHAQDAGANVPSGAAAAEADHVIADIVVTARKRAESMQSVPIAVSAVSANELREKSITTPYQLLSVIPNLSIATGSAARNDPLYFIRGQGATFGGSPSVVQYFAEVPQQQNSASGGQNITFYDLESVQVLKGPQGTLFGRSSTGGAVLFTPRKPTGELDGYVEASFGNYSARELTGAINIPILDDKLAIRIAANSSYHAGYAKSITTGQDLDDRDRKSFRIGLMIRPTDWLSSYTLFQDQDVKENGTANVLFQFNPNHPLLNTNTGGQARLIITGLCGAIGGGQACINDRIARVDAVRNGLAGEFARQQAGNKDTHRTNATSQRDFLRSHTQQVINTTQIEFGHLGFLGDTSLKNIFALQKQLHSETVREIQGSPVATGVVLNDLDYNRTTGQIVDNGRGKTKWGDIFSEEVQLAGKAHDYHDWIIGYFYERSNRNQYLNYPAIFNTLNGAFTVPAGIPGVSTGFNRDYLLRQTGLFAQTTIDFADFGLDGVKFTAGYRKSTLLNRLTAIGAIFTPTSIQPNPNDPGIKAKDKENEDTYTFALDWKITPKVLVYGTTRRGFKQGGINIQAVPFPTAPGAVPYIKPEIVTDYEIGTKTDWTIGDIYGRTNIAAFYSDYSDLQRAASFIIPGTANNASQIANIAASKIKGIELENNVQLTPQLRFDFSYSYLDAKYKEYPGSVRNSAGATVLLIDSPFTGAPKHKFNISGHYDFPLPEEIGNVSFSADYSYQTRIYTNDEAIYNANPKAESQPAFGLMNVRLDWENIKGNPVDLSFYVRNVFDKLYLIGTGGLLNTLGTVTRINGDPRTFGVQARVRFGTSADR